MHPTLLLNLSNYDDFTGETVKVRALSLNGLIIYTVKIYIFTISTM